MKFKLRLVSALAVVGLVFPQPYALAAAGEVATRGEVCKALVEAADDYNPGVTMSDIMKGDETGSLNENDPVTRVEALAMLGRAFGEFPEPKGDSARKGYPASNFTDVPDWAKEELKDVLASGIVAGTSKTTLSPNANVTMEQLEKLIRRTYAFLGTNLKDDFYAAVNKEWLDSSTLLPGRAYSGALYDLMYETEPITKLIENASADPKDEDSQRIAALYENVLDWDARNELGIKPIKPYLELVDNAKSLDDIMAVQQKLSDDYAVNLLVHFGLSLDAKDSTRYTVGFSAMSPSLNKAIYAEDSGAKKEAYIKYIRTILTLCGYDEAAAQSDAERFWEMEKTISPAALDREEYGDIDKTYNVYTMDELRALFPKVDLDAVYAQSGLDRSDSQIIVDDPGLLKAAAVYFNDAHLEDLQSAAKVNIVAGFAGTLGRDFETAANEYQKEFMGVEGTQTDEEKATQIIKSYLSDELGHLYIEEYFSPEAKADVEDMVKDFIAIYKDKIQNLSWMSAGTKAKAIEKLDSMGIKVGYPDEGKWNDYLKGVHLKSKEEGGSYFDNVLTITKAYKEYKKKMQREGVNKDEWAMSVYTVNACYVPTNNEIVFPAGILQLPMYDVNASREQNLGSIGYVIAHEITHAFDNNGAKYDKNGNATDWWTAKDYEAFQKLCSKAVDFYDGVEAAPGIECNGTLTLSENIADMGAASCILAAAKLLPEPDLETMFRSMAKTWQSTMPRESAEYATLSDVHAPDKLRGILPLQTLDEFYEVFDIKPGDGMYIAPEERVSVW